jgi:formylmethanofuran dehydrogenase subunit A
MCIICASIPAAAAVGAKLNAGQLNKPEEKRKPIGKITGMFIGLLVIASVVYHSLRWQG